MQHKLINFEVTEYIETNENEIEFYVTLKKMNAKNINRKKQLASLPKLTPETDRMKELEKEVDRLTAELELITGSISWRITKGLRASKRVYQKVANSGD